jgi:hypothetical protein
MLYFWDKKHHRQRTAQLIEALYLHCGVPLNYRQHPYGSDVGCAVISGNRYASLEVLVRKCKAVFWGVDLPMNFISSVPSLTKTLPLLL